MTNKVKKCIKHMRIVLEHEKGCDDFMTPFDNTNPYGFDAIKECWNCRFIR